MDRSVRSVPFGTVTIDGLFGQCKGFFNRLAWFLALTRPGDAILAESAIYTGLRSAAAQLGRRVVVVDVDESGMRPDALEKACRKHRARLVYLNPTLQNPTAHTMPEQRRREIAQTAIRCGGAVIEDDPYSLLAGGTAGADAAPPPLARFAPRHVYHNSTLSKCLTPGLRSAFVLLASTPQVPGVGIHVWLTLPSYWTSAELAEAAHAEGLTITPSEAFYTGALPPNAVRLSLGSIRERNRLPASLRKLSHLLARKPAAWRGIIV